MDAIFDVHVGTLLSALAALHSNGSSMDQRREAECWLIAFQRTQECWAVCKRLIEDMLTTQDVQVCYFADPCVQIW